ncbi:acyl-ACP thioesterase domain-containing protein [Candidatus Chlorohelix sp.]|uniref:acyl-ACP thioesterase domain-containing protein n=1 Tax=Candidatus Chlorohelix sp. TaxID=3139201 RepID=UPI0030518714
MEQNEIKTRRFDFTYSVRFDEVDLFGYLTPASASRYMQDIARRDAAGVELPEGFNWLAKRTLIDFNRPIPACANLQTVTFPIGFSRVTAQRAYEFRLEGDNASLPAIKARTLWVYVDAKGHPARIPPEASEIWLPNGAQPQLNDPAWLPFPATAPLETNGSVLFSRLDILAHMNNTAYFEMLDDAGWGALMAAGISPLNPSGALLPLHYDIEYMNIAEFGDALTILNWFSPTPSHATEFERLQQIRQRDGLVARARSRWRWLKQG